MHRSDDHVKCELMPVPKDILSLYRAVTMCIDIMFINKLPFLVTVSRHIKFTTIKMLTNRQEQAISKCLTKVMQLYGSRGFLVTMVHADSEFEVIRPQLAAAGSGLNVCSVDEHVPEEVPHRQGACVVPLPLGPFSAVSCPHDQGAGDRMCFLAQHVSPA